MKWYITINIKQFQVTKMKVITFVIHIGWKPHALIRSAFVLFYNYKQIIKKHINVLLLKELNMWRICQQSYLRVVAYELTLESSISTSKRRNTCFILRISETINKLDLIEKFSAWMVIGHFNSWVYVNKRWLIVNENHGCQTHFCNYKEITDKRCLQLFIIHIR